LQQLISRLKKKLKKRKK